jgi:hypothetical protein
MRCPGIASEIDSRGLEAPPPASRRFVSDFYCGEAQIVVETDGPIHDTLKYARRTPTQ